MKRFLILVIVLLILGAVSGGFLLYERNNVLKTALADAGLDRSQVQDVDIEYKRGAYEVEFEAGGRDFHYMIDPVTKQVLRSAAD